MKLAAEKNLNKFAFPVINLKGEKIEYPFKIDCGTWGFACDNGIFGAKHWMILDILGTYIIHRFYNNNQDGKIEFSDRIPTSNDNRVKYWSNFCFSYKMLKYITKRLANHQDDIIPPAYYSDEGRIPYEVDQQNFRIKRVQILNITDSYLKSQLPFLKKYSSKQICEIIKQTSDCKILMNLPIRFFDGKNYQNFPYNNYHKLYTFFNLINVVNSKLSKDGHILEREYEIRFDTPLGYFYIQNCISCYTDLLPGKFYLMSDYAQLFYRMLILPYYNNVKNPIGIEEIKKRLVLKTKDTYMVRKIIKRILDELESNTFIKDPIENKSKGKYQYSYIKTPWKEIDK